MSNKEQPRIQAHGLTFSLFPFQEKTVQLSLLQEEKH